MRGPEPAWSLSRDAGARPTSRRPAPNLEYMERSVRTHTWRLRVLWLLGVPVTLLLLFWLFGIGPVAILSSIRG
jgi:hypothetical protein